MPGFTPSIEPPRVVRIRPPEYTPEALDARIEGCVGLEITVSEEGVVTNVTVTRSLDPELDQNAVECVRAAVYRSGTRNGVPISTVVPVQIHYQLPESSDGQP